MNLSSSTNVSQTHFTMIVMIHNFALFILELNACLQNVSKSRDRRTHRNANSSRNQCRVPQRISSGPCPSVRARTNHESIVLAWRKTYGSVLIQGIYDLFVMCFESCIKFILIGRHARLKIGKERSHIWISVNHLVFSIESRSQTSAMGGLGEFEGLLLGKMAYSLYEIWRLLNSQVLYR